MKKIFFVLIFSLLFIGCKTVPQDIPTTPIIDNAINQSGEITTQIITVEKIIEKIITDDSGKKQALEVIKKLKSDSQDHEKTLSKLKDANDLFSERYWKIIENYNKQKEKLDSLKLKFIISIGIIILLVSIIFLPFYKMIFKFFSKLFF